MTQITLSNRASKTGYVGAQTRLRCQIPYDKTPYGITGSAAASKVGASGRPHTWSIRAPTSSAYYSQLRPYYNNWISAEKIVYPCRISLFCIFAKVSSIDNCKISRVGWDSSRHRQHTNASHSVLDIRSGPHCFTTWPPLSPPEIWALLSFPELLSSGCYDTSLTAHQMRPRQCCCRQFTPCINCQQSSM